MVDRRRVLAVVASGSLSVSGCLKSDSNDKGVIISSVRLLNEDSDSNEITLRLTDSNGTELLQEIYLLDPKSLTEVEVPVDERGIYTVEAAIDTETLHEMPGDYADADDTCVRPTIRIVNSSRVYWEVSSYKRC